MADDRRSGSSPPHWADEHGEGPDLHRDAAEAPPAPARRPAHLKLVSDRTAAKAGVGTDTRPWALSAIKCLEAERMRPRVTPLVAIPCPELPGISFILKDESAHPTGSLKHRLAHALFTHGIASGEIAPGTLLTQGSSGSTAIAEAWFARKLGLRYLAVLPATTTAVKLDAIRDEEAEIVLAKPGAHLARMAADIAREEGGYHLDQFARAADACDWRGDGNIAAEAIEQLKAQGYADPRWIVAGAGTGGTASTIGRYLRTRPELAACRLCVVDPEGSAYFRYFATGDAAARGVASPVVEGIGRGRTSPAFLPGVIDHMVSVSDEGSVAGAHWIEERIGRRFGPSTGTSMIGALILGQAMARRGESGTILLLGCDRGERYADTIYDPAWCAERRLDCGGWHNLLRAVGAPQFPAAF